MDALLSRQTWELVPSSLELLVISYHWVFPMKYRPDSTVDRYKARLVARGFTQTYGVEYQENFLMLLILMPFMFCSLWLLISSEICFSWMWRTLSYIVTSMRRFIQSNLLGILLNERIWCVNSRRGYMAWIRVCESGLRSSSCCQWRWFSAISFWSFGVHSSLFNWICNSHNLYWWHLLTGSDIVALKKPRPILRHILSLKTMQTLVLSWNFSRHTRSGFFSMNIRSITRSWTLGYKPMQTLIDADTDLWDESRLIL